MSREHIELRFLISLNSANKVSLENDNQFNTNRILKEYSTIANITGAYTSERILSLSGYDTKLLCSALEDILLSIYDKNTKESSINWLLDEAQVNYLTTNSIQQLNSILESSSTLIDVYVLNCPKSSERVVRVKGLPCNVSGCVFDLCSLLKWCSIKRSRKPYDSDNARESLASDYGGFCDSSPQEADESLVAKVPFSWETSNVHETYTAQLKKATALVQAKAFPLTFSTTSDCIDDKELEEYTMPLHLLPMVVGEAGSRLRQICDESNTSVELKIDERNSCCNFVVQGTSEEIENARHLMRLCIQILGKKISQPSLA